MGYRSQVVFWVEEEAVKQLLVSLNKNKPAFDMLFSNADVERTEEGHIRFDLDWIKWYRGSYEAVDAVESFMDELDSDEKDHLYGFHRLGEDFGDHDCRGCSDVFHVSISQKMEIE